MKNLILAGTLLVFLFSSILTAQENNNQERGNKKDVKNMFEYLGLGWSWGAKGTSRPFVEGNYGLQPIGRNDFDSEFALHGLAGATIGYSNLRSYSNGILKLDAQFVTGSYTAYDINEFSEPKKDEIKLKITRFGLGVRHGYGYDLALFDLVPYTQHAFTFNKIEGDRNDNLTAQGEELIDRYKGAYRFGFANEAAVKLRLLNFLDVTGGMEYSVVYPRVIFWEWLLSYTTAYIGMGIVSEFAKDIVKQAPIFGPLAYFVVTNGLTYGYFLATQENMNWPFDSEQPLYNHVAKLSVSISF